MVSNYKSYNQSNLNIFMVLIQKHLKIQQYMLVAGKSTSSHTPYRAIKSVALVTWTDNDIHYI